MGVSSFGLASGGLGFAAERGAEFLDVVQRAVAGMSTSNLRGTLNVLVLNK
jgi:hypothetical protein